MSKLREEIERQFKANGLLPEVKEQTQNQEPPADDQSQEQVAVTVMVPKSYQEKFAEDFKNLPQEWQDFLSQHEEILEKQLSDYALHLAAYQKLEELFSKNAKRLKNEGFEKIQDWLEGLVYVDTSLNERPAETIQALAAVYGVKADIPQRRGEPVSEDTVARLHKLEHNFHNLAEYLHKFQAQRLFENLHMFGRQRDAEGNLLHPYFDAVKEQMLEMLSNGAARDIDEAYNSSLWLNPLVREELINKQISSKAAEAEKAKKAAFAPKGKTEEPQRELTLREELEKNMAALMD